MTDSKIAVQGSTAASSVLQGVWKAHSDVQKQKFDELIKDATNRTHKGDSAVSRLNTHTSKNTIDFFVKLDVTNNTSDKPTEPSASPLTEEDKAILADSQSQLNTRTLFSKVTHKLMNPTWDFTTAHFIKL